MKSQFKDIVEFCLLTLVAVVPVLATGLLRSRAGSGSGRLTVLAAA